jgi:hypothetical protein
MGPALASPPYPARLVLGIDRERRKEIRLVADRRVPRGSERRGG